MKKLVIAAMPVKNKDSIVTVLYEDGRAVELYIDDADREVSVGDIYLGYVENISASAGGAFVRLKGDLKAFLPDKFQKNITFKTRKNNTAIRPGDELIVQIRNENTAPKLPVVTADVKITGKKQLTEEIKRIGVTRTACTCLYMSDRIWSRIAAREGEKSFDRIVTDVAQAASDIPSAVSYEDTMLKLYKLYNLSTLIDRCTDKKVWLDSGGYLFIEKTEAFYSIDVNSGKSAAKTGDGRLKFNMEAGKTALEQIRLRQLSGMILIDFINMDTDDEKKQLIEYMKKLALKDPVHTEIVDITPLGIMEITRRRIGRSL